MWTTKTENDSMNIRLLSAHSARVWSTTWLNSIGRWWGIRTHKHISFFIQYKTATAPSFDITRWWPMQHPPLFIVYTLTFGQRSSAAKSLHLFKQCGAEKVRIGGGGRRKRLKNTSVFALLWLFVRPVRGPWLGAWFLGWFLGCPWAWPSGPFGCARWWGRPGRREMFPLHLCNLIKT